MSFGFYAREFEARLAAHDVGESPEERVALARRIFRVKADAWREAMSAAPEILFVGSAGNDDLDTEFIDDAPSAFDLPNLIIVGAVDHAGDEAASTSYGNVDVYAHGVDVESVVPGGEVVAMSGTSMATPQVTNLAAKLLALKPELTVAELRRAIIETADEKLIDPDRRIRLLNPRAAVERVLGPEASIRAVQPPSIEAVRMALGDSLPRQDYNPRLEPTACMFPRGAWADSVRIECSWLIVPEDRSRPDGPSVRLAVAIMRASNTAAKTPLVLLHGGPGLSGIDPAYGALPGMARDPLRNDRDLIFYDQRGAGYSRPRLCPDYDDSITANQNRITRATGPTFRTPLVRSCITSLREQAINPDAYTTTASALDLVDLRRALGYQQWDVNGESYGSRLALEAMRVDRAGIRSVVLIGPVHPGWQQIDAPLIRQRTLEHLFAVCAAHAACRSAFPHPEEDFHALYDELSREPLHMVSANEPDTLVLNADRFIGGITSLLRISHQPSAAGRRLSLAHIPLILHELRHGDRVRAARALVGMRNAVRSSLMDSRPLRQLVNCYESMSRQELGAAVDSINALVRPPFRQRAPDMNECALWRTTFASATERSAVYSDIPTLILVGEFDVVTPPAYARLIASTLTKAHVYELPGHSHSGRPPCLRTIMQQFLNDPSREPDASCIAQMPRIAFATRWPEN
jgi:pimeloyl-ACP methyl ester carboxylesterase